MMPGSVARNPHEGSRAEILADYLFSTWGTVTPVRRQDDYGIDLFCTLTEPIGQRAVVKDYYSVQVKSTDDPWIIEGNDAIRWLVDHPTPLFLACVDKRAGVLTVYQTLTRFLGGFWEPQGRLELVPTAGDDGRCAQWRDPVRFELSAPILRVTISDLLDKERLAHLRQVLQFWVGVDRENCTFRRMGLLRLREPHQYRPNEVPVDAGTVEQGMTKPTPEQFALAIRTVVEALDCVGHQLLEDGDRKSALYAGMLLNHLRTAWGSLFKGDPRWGQTERWSLETQLAYPLNQVLYPDDQTSYLFKGFDEVIQQVEQLSTFAQFCTRPAAQKQ